MPEILVSKLHKLVQACCCMVYARDPDLPNIPYCSLRQLETCYMPTLQAFHKSSYECACPLPCTKVEYQGQISTSSFHKRTTTGQRSRHLDLFVTGPGMGQGRWGTETQESDRLYLELRIYPDSLFTHVEEHVPTYSWSNMFGNVGGQMGLFTGASVLTLLEFLELTILVAAVLCRHGYSALRRRLSSTQGSLLPLDNGVRT
ncbi:hypothetical protein RRG08_031624 [Elysia crispata]|uniref:Uncharacterized protein n=1 Tax=Elysia crispata TaxID=231223 RepID=A0AAE1CJU4_9GAST|nr:hypothetical protein RRG08_031624 [Elysia crispata]